MKLASLKHGRDGQLVVVSRDLTRYADASILRQRSSLRSTTGSAGCRALKRPAEEIELRSD